MIPVYPLEIKDGISNLVKANASLAYLSPISKDPRDITDAYVDKAVKFASAQARRNIDRMDLYPIQTILVSTGRNENYDIFTKDEAWEARFSAEDKPFNFMHKQRDIIGHITENFVIDDGGRMIPSEASLEEVPDKFHIVTPAVIYRFWEDKAQKDRIERLIAEIESGNKWFVSMECLFADFDYGLTSPEGESRIVARNHETAGLTKYLKQYGGTGVIEGGYTIGRVLRKIIFSGKGLVSNPANKESIIFNNTKTFASVSTDLGYINLTCSNTNESKGKSIMAEKELVASVATLNIEDNAAFKLIKSENDNLKKTVAELTTELSKVSSQSTAEKVTSLEKEITSLKASLTEVTAKLEKSEAAAKDFAEAKDKAEAEKDEVKKDFENMKKEKTKAERVSALVSLNAPKEEADRVVAEFSDLSDEKFASIAALLSNKWSTQAGAAEEAENKTKEEFKKAGKAGKSEEKEEKAEKDGDCSKAEKVVETAKAEADANLGVTNVDNLESTVASINNWFNSKVRGRTNKKD
jgi:hypothetical protein